jgi:hypothetical protein
MEMRNPEARQHFLDMLKIQINELDRDEQNPDSLKYLKKYKQVKKLKQR